MTIAFYPGSFDPPHLGHYNIITRASNIFETVFVGIGINPKKKPRLNQEVRHQLLYDAFSAIKNIRIVSYDGITTLELARSKGANVILRGVRSGTDLDSEMTMAAIHRKFSMETVLMPTEGSLAHISSTAVKECFDCRLDISQFVSPEVLKALEKELEERK